MKKTLSIHLGRQLFVIEEDAFDRLHQYLQRLERSLNNETGIAEIIEDIEMRFTELLQSYLGETRKVVTITDIEKAVASLGEPEEISDEPAQQSAPREEKSTAVPNSGDRRFFRDPEGGLLGGVCAGLAAYLQLDPLIVRILFLLISFVGIGIPLYIILWVIVPNANTPSERLQMHGKKVTVDSLKEEFLKATDRIKNDTLRARDRIQADNEHIIQRTKQLSRLIGKLVGIGLLCASTMWLIFFTLVVTGVLNFIPVSGDTNYASMHDFLQLFAPDKVFTLMWAAILVTGLSSAFVGLLVGIRLLGYRNRSLKITTIVTSGIFFAGMIMGLVSGLQTGREFAVYAEVEQQHLMVNANELQVEELPQYTHHKKVIATGGFDFAHIQQGTIRQEGILITYRPSNDSLFHIYQVVSAHGIDRTAALKRSSHIRHTMQLKDNKLQLNLHYFYPKTDGFRNQEVQVIIEVPRYKNLRIASYDVIEYQQEHSGTMRPGYDFEPWR